MTTAPYHSDIDSVLAVWRQGDVALGEHFFLHVADLVRPLTTETAQTAQDNGIDASQSVPERGAVWSEAPGVVVITQTCDIVRTCSERPYLEIAPLVQLEADFVEEVRRLRRPAWAYVPGVADQNLVADLDRVMTIEKSLLLDWVRIQGCHTDEERRNFADALARKRNRPAFPDDFSDARDGALRAFRRRLQEKHNRNSAEGAHLRALREIRVRAAPDWSAPIVYLTFWYIREHQPQGFDAEWSKWVASWEDLIDQNGRYRIEASIPCQLRDLTAQDYVESDRLEFDQLSA